MNADNAIGLILPDNRLDGAGLGLGKWGGSGLFVIKTVGCCKITVQVHTAGVVTAVSGHSVGIGHG
ncbi:hypothetical protein ES703_80604 [subsurface metagenome]